MTTTSRRRWHAPALGALALTTGLALGACGGDDGGKDAGSASGGAALYEQNCASCHGGDLRGTDRGPSHLSQVYEPGHHPDAAFRAAITQGARAHHWDFGDMPPVAGLDDAEIDAIIGYVREQQDTHGFEPYPPE